MDIWMTCQNFAYGLQVLCDHQTNFYILTLPHDDVACFVVLTDLAEPCSNSSANPQVLQREGL